MVEFQKVMHEWKRMCAATSFCELCPLKDEKCWATYPSKMVGDLKSIESIIMAWAAEHPEPVYPTWGEWLQRLYDNTNYAGIFITPIPADIAQKLGIAPKGGT